MSCPSWPGGRGNLLGLQLGRQDGGVAPRVSCSVLALSVMSVPVRGSAPALSLALALSATLTPVPLALVLSPTPVLTLIVSLALVLSPALTLILVWSLASALAPAVDSVPALFPSVVPTLYLHPRLWLWV